MAHEIFYLGSTGFAQVGNPDYNGKQEIECEVLMEALQEKFGKRIENSGGRLVWLAQEHDFGTYHEVVFKISKDRLNDNIYDLINAMEAFDWDNTELTDKMADRWVTRKTEKAKSG